MLHTHTHTFQFVPYISLCLCAVINIKIIPNPPKLNVDKIVNDKAEQ